MHLQSTIDPEAFKHFEREGYSRVASGYEEVAAPVTAQANDAILDAVLTGPGIALLDVACGPGWLSAAALKRGARVTALDLTEEMVAMARRRCPEAEVVVGDAEHLPFPANHFDAVVCNFGILHLPQPERAIAEAYRVLRSGGRYAFTCWTPPGRNPFFALILDSVQKHGTMEVNLPSGPPLFRFGEAAECTRALQSAGFQSVSVVELPMVWAFSRSEDVVPGVIGSTARIGPLLAQQSPQRRGDIEAAIVEGARKYETPRGVEIPTLVALAVGQRVRST